MVPKVTTYLFAYPIRLDDISPTGISSPVVAGGPPAFGHKGHGLGIDLDVRFSLGTELNSYTSIYPQSRELFSRYLADSQAYLNILNAGNGYIRKILISNPRASGATTEGRIDNVVSSSDIALNSLAASCPVKSLAVGEGQYPLSVIASDSEHEHHFHVSLNDIDESGSIPRFSYSPVDSLPDDLLIEKPVITLPQTMTHTEPPSYDEGVDLPVIGGFKPYGYSGSLEKTYLVSIKIDGVWQLISTQLREELPYYIKNGQLIGNPDSDEYKDNTTGSKYLDKDRELKVIFLWRNDDNDVNCKSIETKWDLKLGKCDYSTFSTNYGSYVESSYPLQSIGAGSPYCHTYPSPHTSTRGSTVYIKDGWEVENSYIGPIFPDDNVFFYNKNASTMYYLTKDTVTYSCLYSSGGEYFTDRCEEVSSSIKVNSSYFNYHGLIYTRLE